MHRDRHDRHEQPKLTPLTEAVIELFLVLAAILIFAALVHFFIRPVHAYSSLTPYLLPPAERTANTGNAEQEDFIMRHWMNNLMQPDASEVSCCGEADAFESDLFVQDKQGQYVAVITDGRGIIPDGTLIHIPDGKLRKNIDKRSLNPTGHGWVFLHVNSFDDFIASDGAAPPGTVSVYCYEPPAGA